MTYQNAKKLHNGDKITYKPNGKILTVVEIKTAIPYKEIYFVCDDGYWYNHRTIQLMANLSF